MFQKIKEIFSDNLPDADDREAEGFRIANKIIERNIDILERMPTKEVIENI